jgi:Ca2+/Na+ antiporter
MSSDSWLMLSIFVVGLASLIGFFATKTKGYGRYATSTFLILVVVVLSSLMYSAGKFDGQIMANILFAVVGFAGGLFTGKEQESSSKQGAPNNQVNKDASR